MSGDNIPVQIPVQQVPIQEQVVGQQYITTQQPQQIQYVSQQQQPMYISQPQQVLQSQAQQQFIEGPPQSQGPIQTTVQQGQAQMGESRFEYIPKEKVWVEYEAVQSTQMVPKEVKLTDHYAVEHITEYHPKTFQDTYIDYHPVERNVERVEYQQVMKKVNHPMVQSEITETILPVIQGPQTLIESKSQIVETGQQENVSNLPPRQAPMQSGIIGQQQVVQEVVQSVPVVGSRVVTQQVQAPVYQQQVQAPVYQTQQVQAPVYQPQQQLVNSRVVVQQHPVISQVQVPSNIHQQVLSNANRI